MSGKELEGMLESHSQGIAEALFRGDNRPSDSHQEVLRCRSYATAAIDGEDRSPLILLGVFNGWARLSFMLLDYFLSRSVKGEGSCIENGNEPVFDRFWLGTRDLL